VSARTPPENEDSWVSKLAVIVTSLIPVALIFPAMDALGSPNGYTEQLLFLIPSYSICGAFWWALAVPSVRDEVRLWVGDEIPGDGPPRLTARAIGNVIAGVAIVALGQFLSLEGPYLWPAYVQAGLGVVLLVVGIGFRR
jgi:hypothetical protein